MFNNSPPENRAVYEIMLKNIVETDRPQMMLMGIACWITKATDTHSEYVTHTAFQRQQRLQNAPIIQLY